MLQPGESCLSTFEGQEVAVFNVEGRLYAIGNKCPHRGGPLSRGRVEGGANPAVRCPIHGWLFDLTTGACLNQPQAKVPAYQATCQNGEFIGVRPRGLLGSDPAGSDPNVARGV